HGAERLAVQKQLRALAIRVHMYVARLPRFAPTDWPGVAVDMGHGLVGPVRLEDEVRLLLGQVPLDYALLIDPRNAVVVAQGRDEVLEYPLGRPGKPVELLLGLQVPVEEIAGVGLRPVAVLGDASLAAGLQ